MKQEMQDKVILIMDQGSYVFTMLNDHNEAMELASLSALIRAFVELDDKDVWERAVKRSGYLMIEPLVAADNTASAQMIYRAVIAHIEKELAKIAPAPVLNMAVAVHCAAAFFHLISALSSTTEDFALWEEELSGSEA